MSKKNRFNNGNRDRSNYNKPDPNIDAIDALPTDEEVGEPELNVKNLNVEFIPNSLVYNAYGIAPTTATYRVLMKDLKEMFAKICKSQIDGVEGVTAAYDSSIGEVQFFCMFNENCRHFNDRSMADTMLSNERPQYFSPEVKAFAKKFGLKPYYDLVRDKNGKIVSSLGSKFGKDDHLNAQTLFVKSVDGSNNLTRAYCMRLSWTTLIRLIFDQDGKAFEAKYGLKPSRCRLECHFEFSKAGDQEFGKILYLEVTKSANMISGSGMPRPKVSFNYREA